RKTSRSAQRVLTLARPPLYGWRVDPLQQVHLRTLYIRKLWKRQSRHHLDSSTLLARPRPVKRSEASQLRKEFSRHSKQWLRDTTFTSSVSDMILHPSYQRIIGLGPGVVPLILRRLERKPEYWFWALEAITGATPVPDPEKGRPKLAAKRWLEWG